MQRALARGRVTNAPHWHIADSGKMVTFVQLDDLSGEQFERVQPASLLIHATGPGNHQAWIAVSAVGKGDSKEFVRRVRTAVGDADKTASGATRMAGIGTGKRKSARAAGPQHRLWNTRAAS
jgi:RepB DNA-primase from phage plasmid